MKYVSTRSKIAPIESSEAILKGIASDGGLFVPESFPQVTLEQIESMKDMDYRQRARFILGLYLTDMSDEQIEKAVNGAYAEQFDDEAIAPLSQIGENGEYVMELWHGPTLAFKDMALQLLPRLMVNARAITNFENRIVILVATSGDTGKAALEGFKDVDGIGITVYYPKDGVSGAQKLQMVTTGGNNTNVVAVEGNFDDAQTGVKRIFADKTVCDELSAKGISLSSANSINWGRLVPQIVYYFHAYASLAAEGKIKVGDKVNFVVPTGNFGNILAGWYAKQMGLPVEKMICASNKNNVLTDFFHTGHYNARREFHKTVSPSMDILISSNLERLLFELNGRDVDVTAQQMRDLSINGNYDNKTVLNCEEFYAGCATEEETLATIKKYFNEYGYLMDTHTAVAQSVFDEYCAETGDKTPTVVVSTASAYKFTDSVLNALGEDACGDEFTRWEKLFAVTGQPIPTSIAELRGLPIRHTAVCKKEDMVHNIK